MEQHPVPQNVTTFQFRLVGDMTLKQFGYLAAGVVAAFIFYKLPLPFFFTYPLAAISALLGFGLAFVPIEERPMDVWIMAFMKNVYNPTQWVWQHAKTPPSTQIANHPAMPASATTPAAPTTSPSPTPIVQPAVKTPVHPTNSIPNPGSPAGELVNRLFNGQAQKIQPAAAQPSASPTILTKADVFDFKSWLKKLFPQKPATPSKPAIDFKDTFAGVIPKPAPSMTISDPVAQSSTPKPQITQPIKTPETAEKTAQIKILEENFNKLKDELEKTKNSQDRILELQKQLTEALSTKDKLAQEVAALRQNTKPAPPPSVIPSPASTKPNIAPPTVRIITPEGAVRAGLPRLTTFPNIITGIIKDSQGNLLSGVLITARDKNDIPLRALKTNKLGQFAASTPLPNGDYFIEVEDPRAGFIFDRIQITVNGAVMPPLEIFAKSQKQISRDKLAREIFGNPKPI